MAYMSPHQCKLHHEYGRAVFAAAGWEVKGYDPTMSQSELDKNVKEKEKKFDESFAIRKCIYEMGRWRNR